MKQRDPLAPIQLAEDVTGDGPQISYVPIVKSTLKRESKLGVCLWWSDQQPCFLHPDDAEVAQQLVPSRRVLRRSECENFADRELGYSLFQYGELSFRALPAIWMEVTGDGYEIGDFVQVKSQHGKRHPMVATICEISWNPTKRIIEYELAPNDRSSGHIYAADELQPATRLESHLKERELKLQAKSRLI